jgi:hypothetical protein
MKKYLGILALSTLIACNDTGNNSAEKKDNLAQQKTTTASTAPIFKEPKISGIYTDYLKLKDALVAAHVDDAKSAAKLLVKGLKNYTGCENTAVIAQKLVDAKDIATQRKEFTGLSSDVIALFKHADISAGAIYVQHCPMANNGDGGDWLAAEKKIQNPYYGAEMMECGAVIEEIKAE